MNLCCLAGKIKDMDKKMERAQELGIQVVPVDILDEFESAAGGTAALLINKKNIAPWGINVSRSLCYLIVRLMSSALPRTGRGAHHSQGIQKW
jgi:hypothetical protein